jgi:hypothetical protein
MQRLDLSTMDPAMRMLIVNLGKMYDRLEREFQKNKQHVVTDAEPESKPLAGAYKPFNEELKPNPKSGKATAAARVDERSENFLNHTVEAFDRNRDYGPCCGMTRRARYTRALLFHKKYNDPAPPALLAELMDIDSSIGDYVYKY